MVQFKNHHFLERCSKCYSSSFTNITLLVPLRTTPVSSCYSLILFRAFFSMLWARFFPSLSARFAEWTYSSFPFTLSFQHINFLLFLLFFFSACACSAAAIFSFMYRKTTPYVRQVAVVPLYIISLGSFHVFAPTS